VKWCGKSAPRPEQSGWQGKPHVEQDQIGEEERPAPLQLPGRLLEPISNDGPRGMVATRFIAGTETGLQSAQVYSYTSTKLDLCVHKAPLRDWRIIKVADAE